MSQQGGFLFSGSIEKVNYLFVLVLAIVGISPVLAHCGNDITRKVYLGTDHFTVMSLHTLPRKPESKIFYAQKSVIHQKKRIEKCFQKIGLKKSTYGAPGELFHF